MREVPTVPPNPILLIGGSGHVGRHTARYLRAAHPDVPILIGGRDVDRARAVASEVGGAEGLAVDLSMDDLGLRSRPVGAVATLFTDARVAGLRFAQDRGVPYVSPSPGTFEIAPEVAAGLHATARRLGGRARHRVARGGGDGARA